MDCSTRRHEVCDAALGACALHRGAPCASCGPVDPKLARSAEIEAAGALHGLRLRPPGNATPLPRMRPRARGPDLSQFPPRLILRKELTATLAARSGLSFLSLKEN